MAEDRFLGIETDKSYARVAQDCLAHKEVAEMLLTGQQKLAL